MEDEANKFNCQHEAKALIEAIGTFRDRINVDKGFVRYKTFVGYESVFPQDWADENFSYQRADEYHNTQIKAFVESIKPENEMQWLAFMESCVSTKSNDLATFPIFGAFVVALAKAKPALVERFLKSATIASSTFCQAFS
ncbi:MAG: hypothetical protein H7240_00850, partial [Glaciimonas sp.]|nr:hypothetical protein [Glaciimonas sp.]